MRIQNTWASVAFKLALVASSTVGLLIQTGLIGDGPINLGQLVYFTLLSNLLAALYFLVDAIAVARTGNDWNPQLKGAATMSLIVTGLIYNLILANTSFSMDVGDAGTTMEAAMNSTFISALGNTLLHKVSPLMIVLDWILFDPKGRFTKTSPFLWVLVADVYFIFATVRGFMLPLGTENGRFPYFFIDWDILGWKVIPIVIALNAAFIALGFVMVFIDGKLAGIGKQQN